MPGRSMKTTFEEEPMEDPFAEMEESLQDLEKLKERIAGSIAEKEAMLNMAQEEEKKREGKGWGEEDKEQKKDQAQNSSQ